MLQQSPDENARPQDLNRSTLDDKALDLLFRDARSQNGWLPQDVSDEQLKAVWDIAKWGPTSANCCPMRILFLRNYDAKSRLRPHFDASNINKVMTAPIVALIGFDTHFYEHLPRLFHNPDARTWYEGLDKREVAYTTSETLPCRALI